MALSRAIIAVGLWAAATGAATQEAPYLSLQRLEPGLSVCAGGVCQAGALDGFFQALAETESKDRSWPVRIAQLGDSHTAGGLITARLRTGLQGRFGHHPAPDEPQFAATRPGIQMIEVGVVGATLADSAKWPEVEPTNTIALTILAFGVNEGFDDALDPAAYEVLLRGQVERLRRHGASLLILGAPDALRSGVAHGCSVDGQRAPPRSLALVRDVQRRVAADMGVAFWDWHGRMGGDCSADRLAMMGEAYMRGDRVHFTSAGADWIGGVLHADLMTAYETWKAARPETGATR